MQPDRERNKRGYHVSVSGDPAEEMLGDLVAQFSDPYAFVRELIQNSLDAGAQRIELVMQFRDNQLVVEAIDDGEGMDRATIEGYLLTLFRSTKEEDLTKIGKFGIGFVSLFAIQPRRVVVETGRDAIWHRVIFAEDRSYTLVQMPDPFEGTTVRLELPRSREQAQQDCERIRESAMRWCGFAEAEITTSASGIPRPWPATAISRPFTVDAPVSTSHKEDGLWAVLGPSRNPTVGFYNQGLTLWEGETALIEGVSFRVMGRHLEHTLTRDNVIRDRHFDRVMSRLKQLASTDLGEAVHAALASADTDRAREIFAAISHRHPWKWRPDAPLFPRVGGGHVSLAELGQPSTGWLRGLWGQWPGSSRSKPTLLWGAPADALALAVAARGELVLAGHDDKDAHLRFAAELVGAELVAVSSRFRAPEKATPSPEQAAALAAANALSQRLGLRFVLHPARALGTDRLAVTQKEPYAVEALRPDEVEEGAHLMLDLQHSLWEPLSRLPAEHSGPLLLRAALVGARVQSGPVAPELLAALAGVAGEGTR